MGKRLDPRNHTKPHEKNFCKVNLETLEWIPENADAKEVDRGAIDAETFQCSPNLSSRRCRRHDSWYETHLGFTSYPFPENPPYVFASVSRDQVEIMFQRIDGYQKADLYQLRSGGKLNLDVKPVELMPLINAAVDIVRPAANAKRIQIQISAQASVGPVAGDPARLQQIIWNLLSNAVKFTSHDGRVDISLGRAGSSAELLVRDTGMGIAPEFLPRVFERFRQAESSITRSHRGLGLGLAIVRHLTELHGGSVTAESPGEGLGATFTIRIPLAAMQSGETASTGSEQLEREQTAATRQRLEGVRVLIVEDEPDARELLALTLECSGARVEAVQSVQEALENLQLFKPHVLLSDIGLPLESGYELIRKVRLLSSEASRVPAVALTAFVTEKDQQLALAAGFQLHLAKPVESEILVEAIERLANYNNNSEEP